MDLEVIRRLRTIATVEGAEQATAMLDKIVAAQERTSASAVKLGSTTDTSAKKVASVAGAFDRLSQSIDSDYRATVQLERGVGVINRALDQGVISTTTAAGAMDQLAQKYIVGVKPIDGHSKSLAFNNVQMMMVGHSARATFEGLASGQPIWRIATQQGIELSQALSMSEGGAAGALAGMGEAALALATPMNLVIAGAVAAGVAFLAYSVITRDRLPSVDETLKAHVDLIAKIKDAYGEAAVAADGYSRESRNVLTVGMQSDVGNIQAQLNAAANNLVNQVTTQMSATRSGMGPRVVSGDFVSFQSQIEDLRRAIAAGSPDIKQFRESISSAIQAEPADSALHQLGERMMDLSAGAAKLNDKLLGAKGVLAEFSADSASAAAKFDTLTKSIQALSAIAAPQIGPLGQIDAALKTALTNVQSGDDVRALNAAADAARQRAQDATIPLPRPKPDLLDYDPDSFTTALAQKSKMADLDVRAAGARDAVTKANIAAEREYATVLNQTADADKAAAAAKLVLGTAMNVLMVDTSRQTQDMRDDVAIRGKWLDQVAAGNVTIAEAQEKMQIEQRLRPLTISMLNAEGYARYYLQKEIENQTAALNAQADEQKRASALQILSQQRDQIDQMRLEIAMVGQSAAAHARASAILQKEQELRSQGIDLGSKEAQQAVLNASALADYNTALQRMQAAQQSIQDIGGSAIDSFTGALASGKLDAESLTSALQGLEKQLLDLAVGNPLKNLLGANLPTMSDVFDRLQGKTPTLPGLGSVLPSTVGTMTVSAASVIVTGTGIGSGIAGAAAGALGANDNANLSAAADAIRKIESGSAAGNYSALGPILKSGDRAYGAYGVMGDNIPSWTEKWLGHRLSPQEFLGNSSAQDSVFQGQFGSYASKYGMDAAPRAWFAGPGGMNNLSATDKLGTSVESYGEQFKASMTQAGAASTKAAQAVTDLATNSQSAAGQVGQFGNALPNALSKIGGGGGGIGSVLDAFTHLGQVAPGGVYADGGVFSGGNVIPFARGGIVSRPTLFPFAAGTGLMGEAGPEAIVPLRRGRDGRLGIESPGIKAPVIVMPQAAAPAVHLTVEDHTSAGHKGTPTETVAPNGDRHVKYVMEDVIADAMERRGSKPFRSLTGTFGAKVARTGR